MQTTVFREKRFWGDQPPTDVRRARRDAGPGGRDAHPTRRTPPVIIEMRAKPRYCSDCAPSMKISDPVM
jgi:hypothetical protein